MSALRPSSLALIALFAALPPLGASTVTTLDPGQAEVVTSDVTHFWQAFDDAAKAPAAQRAGIYGKEYFDTASQGLKDFAAFRHMTPEKLAEHVEQNRDDYAK